MDLQLVKNGLKSTQPRNKLVFALAALGFSGYGVYKVYNLPSVVKKRDSLFKVLGALVSIAEALSDSGEMIGVVSNDLKQYLQSDSDRIPNSLIQISKIARSDEFSESAIKVARALTLGVMRGYRSETGDSSFFDRVMDKLSTPAGSGFVSIVVGSFAKNLVMAFCSDKQSDGDIDSTSKWVNVICDGKGKELIGNSVQLFVSTAVSVYLEKTMNINTFDELFSGLTNPNHERKVRDMFVSISNGAVETLVKTSHKVFDSSDSSSHSDQDQDLTMDSDTGRESNRNGNELQVMSKNSGWGTKMASTLSIPSNRRFVLDITGRVVFETVRSFLQFLFEKLTEGLKRAMNVAHDGVQYVAEKSSVIFSVCMSLCLQILEAPWILVQA